MKKIFLCLLFCLIMLSGCGSKKQNNTVVENNNEEQKVIEEPVVEPEKKEIKIVNIDSNTRPYAIVINNYPGAVKVQTGLADAYMIYELPVEGGMSRSLALYKDKMTTKIGTVRSARHNFLDYAMENDAIFVHFGWSHYAQDDISSLGINNINGLYDAPFWRENPEKLATEHTAYTSLEKLAVTAKNKGYRTTTDVKPLLNYSADEINLEDGITANTVIVPYSNYYTVKFVYDSDNKVYKRYVNGNAHTDYFTGEHYTSKNIIVVKIDFTNTDDNYYLNFYNTGTGSGYYITNGVAKPITWEKTSRSSKTIYRYENGEEITVNDGNTYIMMQSKSKETVVE